EIPGTSPLTVSALEATFHPPSTWAKVTSAETSSRLGGVPFLARRAEKAIEKHAACEAASNSSGLVFPLDSWVRSAQVTPRSRNLPLVAALTTPDPDTRSPNQVASARRTSAMGQYSSGAGCRAGAHR